MNTWGNKIRLSIFGESHGDAIGIVIDGLEAGTKLNLENVNKFIERRKAGKSSFTTSRKEKDEYKILSGYKDGYATGAPLCVIFENTNTILNGVHRPQDYSLKAYYFNGGKGLHHISTPGGGIVDYYNMSYATFGNYKNLVNNFDDVFFVAQGTPSDKVPITGNATYSEGAYAVVMNPETGAILAMAGVKHDLKSGNVSSNSLGTVTDIVVPGSVVKAATLTAGWANNAISGNQTLTDQPIVFGQDSSSITSWFTSYGNRDITAVEALEYSSNTYMVQVALKMMGTPYTPNMGVDLKNLDSSMEKLRETQDTLLSFPDKPTYLDLAKLLNLAQKKLPRDFWQEL